ncbi:MAG: CHRD domain-containing protein [Rufibacter sp.]
MKTKKHLFSLLATLLFMVPFAFTSCSDEDDEPSNEVKLSATLTGAAEVPANPSAATGTFTGTFNKDTKILTYTLTYAGITPTNMHFHKAAVGENGGVVIAISAAPYSSPINAQTQALTPEQEADLLGGLWYVNIHSDQYKPGEIRGQVLVKQ